MNKEYHIAELRVRLMAAKEKLARERLSIFEQFPLAAIGFDKSAREAYGFAYIRAERLGVRTIHRRMAEVSWLPAQIDTSTEISADVRDKLAHWVKHGEESKQPHTALFGNEFIHALARCLMASGADDPAFHRLADRIALLFRDLAYLVSSIHCCNVFKELEVEYLQLSAPNDLGKIALDLTATLEALVLMNGGETGEVNENTPANAQTGVPYLRLVEKNDSAEAPL